MLVAARASAKRLKNRERSVSKSVPDQSAITMRSSNDRAPSFQNSATRRPRLAEIFILGPRSDGVATNEGDGDNGRDSGAD
jgi:hypothetical protein